MVVPPPLSRAFYDRPVTHVASDLLGCRLWRTVGGALLGGRIIETEAYLAARDPASHSHRGLTNRNAAMFGPPGCAYVYAIHARWCFNVVAEPAGVGSAVLIRALEPLIGAEIMQQRRGMAAPRDLTRGPARLCAALAIDRTLDGCDLTTGSPLWLSAGDPPTPKDVLRTPRIGVTAAQHRLLRFVIAEHPSASGARKLNRRPR